MTEQIKKVCSFLITYPNREKCPVYGGSFKHINDYCDIERYCYRCHHYLWRVAKKIEEAKKKLRKDTIVCPHCKSDLEEEQHSLDCKLYRFDVNDLLLYNDNLRLLDLFRNFFTEVYILTHKPSVEVIKKWEHLKKRIEEVQKEI